MVIPTINILIKIFALAVFSWILIHLLAIFGIFLSFSYPLWFLLAPKQTYCWFCRVKKEGEYCNFCRQPVRKANGDSPKSFISACRNALLLLVFSVLSLGLVFGESQILFKLGFPLTPKTVSFVIPPKGQHRLEEIFPMKIEIVGIKTPINAVQADISFDLRKAEVVDISTKDSFANVFIQKEINNEVGYARLTGGLPNPGFFSDRGVFGTVYFKGKTPGLFKVEFLPSSLVLANDSRGTNVVKELASASYLILPEKITAEEEKQQQVIIQPGVLGEQTATTTTQLIFYDEGKVLGSQAVPKEQPKEKVNYVKNIASLIGNIDKVIISFWGKLFR